MSPPLLGYGLEWKTKAVVQSSRGLVQAGGGIRGPKPAVSKVLFEQIANRNPLSDAFVQAVWIGWLFSLSVPSGRLILVGQLPREKVYEDAALGSSAVIGLGKGNYTGEGTWPGN